MKLNLIEIDILKNLSSKAKNILVISPYISHLGKFIKNKCKNAYVTLLCMSDYTDEINKEYYDSTVLFSTIKNISNAFSDKFDSVLCLYLEQYNVKPHYVLNSLLGSINLESEIFMSFYNSVYIEYLQLIAEQGLYTSELLFNIFPFYPLNLELMLLMLANIKSTPEYIHGLLDQKFYLTKGNPLELKNIKQVNEKDKIYNFISYYIIKSRYENTIVKNNINLELTNASFDSLKKIHLINSEIYWKNSSQHLFPFNGSIQAQNEINEAKYVAKIITSLNCESILEVGCGYGRIIKEITNISSKYSIHGIDISPVQIENAESYLEGCNVELSEFDGEKIPFADKSFDIVFTCGTLSLLSPEKAYNLIKEIYRVSTRFIVHVEDHQINNYRLNNHEYDLLYQRHAIPLIFREKVNYLTKTAYTFKKIKDSINWDFDEILKYVFYFMANSISDILNFKNIMRYLPNSQILINSNNHFKQQLIMFLEQRKIPFTDIFPENYSEDKIVIINSNAQFEDKFIPIDKQKYFFVLIFTSVNNISLEISEKYDLFLVPGNYNYKSLKADLNKIIIGLSHLDNAHLKIYPKESTIQLLGINNNGKKILLYMPLVYNQEILEKYIFSLSKEYIILLKFDNNYLSLTNQTDIYDLTNISSEILFSVIDLLITDNISLIIEAISLKNKYIFIDNLSTVIEHNILGKIELEKEFIINSYNSLAEKINYALTNNAKTTDISEFINYHDGTVSYKMIYIIIKNLLQQ